MNQPQAQNNGTFLTPVGRLVGGSLFELADNKGYGSNNQPQRTQGGEEKEQYVAVVAFPKMVNGRQNAEFFALWQTLQAIGQAAFPHLGQIPPFWDPACRFAWKIQDGDGRDGNGNPNSTKAGYAGNWILKLSSKFQPKCYYVGRHAPHEQITDANAIPRGHYIRISGTAQGNNQAQKPGIYVNLNLVEYVGGSQSDVIHTGPSAADAFGGSAAALPPGVQPVMPGPQGAPMGNGMPGQMPGGMPAPQMMNPAALPGMNGPASLGAAAQPGGYPQQMPGQSLGAPGMPGSQPPQGLPGQMPQGLPGGAPMTQMPGASLPGQMPGQPMQHVPMMPGAMPAAGMPNAQPLPGAGYAGTAMMSPGNPGVSVQPNPGFLAGPGGAAAAPGYPPSQMPGAYSPAAGATGIGMSPSSRQMTPAAQGYTYEELIAHGHTDATLRAQGLML